MLFTRSLVSRTSLQAATLRLSLQSPLRRCNMSSSSAPLQEWLVIIPDNAGALEKRLVARPKHLEGLKSDREDMWLWGGRLFSVSFTSMLGCYGITSFPTIPGDEET